MKRHDPIAKQGSEAAPVHGRFVTTQEHDAGTLHGSVIVEEEEIDGVPAQIVRAGMEPSSAPRR
jgi:hypothetical protein